MASLLGETKLNTMKNRMTFLVGLMLTLAMSSCASATTPESPTVVQAGTDLAAHAMADTSSGTDALQITDRVTGPASGSPEGTIQGGMDSNAGHSQVPAESVGAKDGPGAGQIMPASSRELPNAKRGGGPVFNISGMPAESNSWSWVWNPALVVLGYLIAFAGQYLQDSRQVKNAPKIRYAELEAEKVLLALEDASTHWAKIQWKINKESAGEMHDYMNNFADWKIQNYRYLPKEFHDCWKKVQKLGGKINHFDQQVKRGVITQRDESEIHDFVDKIDALIDKGFSAIDIKI